MQCFYEMVDLKINRKAIHFVSLFFFFFPADDAITLYKRLHRE